MSQQAKEIQEFVDECVTEYFNGPCDENVERSSSEIINYVMFSLVSGGLMLMLPELQEWLALGMTTIALKRQEIEKRLIEYANEKELDYDVAKKSAKIVAERLDETTLKTLIAVLKRMAGLD